MPRDITEKQDAFARAYFETGNAAEAYRRAYDVAEDARDGWLYVEACQLLDNPKVSLRLKELQEEAKRLSLFTVMTAFEEYEAARDLAHRTGNPSAAVAAVSGKVKLFGLDKPVRTEVTGKDGQPIKTEDTGAAARALAEMVKAIAERSGKAGDPADR